MTHLGQNQINCFCFAFLEMNHFVALGNPELLTVEHDDLKYKVILLLLSP